MSEITVRQFSDELKMPVAALLEQLDKAGVGKQGERDSLSDEDKKLLLDYLRRSHGGGATTKITLTRKQTSEIKATDAQGRVRTVQGERRKQPQVLCVLDDEQLTFLRRVDVPIDKVFDATGMRTKKWKRAMSDLGMLVAIGVSPCREYGHTLRTRAGHCAQCSPANISY